MKTSSTRRHDQRDVQGFQNLACNMKPTMTDAYECQETIRPECQAQHLYQVTTHANLYSTTCFLLRFAIYVGIHPPFSFINTIVVAT
jgi:hypothetical protein